MMEKLAPQDLEYLAEFERHQFDLYDTRRLAEETHANAVIAAALTVTALVLADYGRKSHPSVIWLVIALLGLLWAFAWAMNARVVSWYTPRWLAGPGHKVTDADVPAGRVRSTLEEVRDLTGDSLALRRLVVRHWRARADSAWRMGTLKGTRLRRSLWGFAGPVLYFAIQLTT